MALRNSPQRFLPAVAIAAAVLLTPMPAAAQIGPLVLYNGPLPTPIVDNPCVVGETVTVTGRMTTTAYARFEGSNVHSTFRVVIKAQGTTNDPLNPNPKKYIINQEELIELNSPMDATFETTHVLNAGYIKQAETLGDNIALGGGDDFMQKIRSHLTVSHGVPTAVVDSFEMKCM